MKPPRILAGRYQLSRPLGSGGMGRVLSGTDRVLERRVAVKILAPHLAQDDKAVSRFRREARSAAGLAHPSIVSVYDSGSENGWHYLVMEHVEGRTLGQILREEGPLHPRRAAEIAADLARALADAHRAGIVHRDVKPGNVMITSEGQVKVVDFGIAAAVSSETATETATVLGTVSYLAPEQVQGRPPDPRSDLYALGVVLFEMLTGRTPFTAETPLAVAYKHVEEPPVAPSSVNPDVPPALDAVVLRAMAKDPEDRYPSAEALLHELEEFLTNPEIDPAATAALARSWAEGSEDTPVGVIGPGAHRAPRSKRWLVVAAIAAALAAAIPTALILSSGDPARTDPPATSPSPREQASPQEPADTASSAAGTQGEGKGKEDEGGTSEDAASTSEEEEAEEPSPTPEESPSASPSPTEDPSPTPTPTPTADSSP